MASNFCMSRVTAHVATAFGRAVMLSLLNCVVLFESTLVFDKVVGGESYLKTRQALCAVV